MMKIWPAKPPGASRRKGVQWTTTVEPTMQWPHETVLMYDHLRWPYRKFLRLQLVGLRGLGLILPIFLAPLWVISGLRWGHWMAYAIVWAIAWCGFLCFAFVHSHIRRWRALHGRPKYKIRITNRCISIDHGGYLFSRMTGVSVRQEQNPLKNTIVIGWGGYEHILIDIPPDISVDSVRQFFPEKFKPHGP